MCGSTKAQAGNVTQVAFVSTAVNFAVVWYW